MKQVAKLAGKVSVIERSPANLRGRDASEAVHGSYGSLRYQVMLVGRESNLVILVGRESNLVILVGRESNLVIRACQESKVGEKSSFGSLHYRVLLVGQMSRLGIADFILACRGLESYPRP